MLNSKSLLKKFSILGLICIFMFLFSATSKAELVRFVVTGDSRGNNNGVNTTILGEIVQATLDEGVDFVLFTGDLVNGSSDPVTLESQLTTWRDTMQPLYDSGIGVYPCRGNHDTGNKAVWDNIFSGVYALPGNGPSGEEYVTFSFTQENVFIVVLDQYGTHPQRVKQTWLDAQFASNTQPHVFVLGHEPAFSVYHPDCLDDYPIERNTFWKSMAAECGRIYFSGHDHIYNHARIDDGDGDSDNDLHQYVVGTAGAPLHNWNGNYDGNNDSFSPQLVHYEKEYGYMLIEVNSFDVTLTWKYRTSPGLYEVGEDEFTYVFYDNDDDGIGDFCDNCPDDNNPGQDDYDEDGTGDVCDECMNDPENDIDGDDVCGDVDNCPDTPNGPDLGTCVKIIGGLFIGTEVVCINSGDCEIDELCDLDQFDFNDNNIGDACECYADVDDDGFVYPRDIMMIIDEFGRTDCCTITPCLADIDRDCNVFPSDLMIFLVEYGRLNCPLIP